MSQIDKELNYCVAQNKMELLPNYYTWIYELFAEHLKNRIADIGCGKGFMLKKIHEQGNYEILLGIDGSLENITNNVLCDTQSDSIVLLHRSIDTYSFADLADYKKDTVILMDVLEHIEDDRSLLECLYRVLMPQSKVIIKVPAVKCLYGPLDVASGHFRRYSKKELKTKAQEEGFKTLKLRYMNTAGVIVYSLKNKFQKKNITFSQTFTSKKLKTLNNLIPYLRLVDAFTPCPFGLSLIGVFEK